MDVFFPMFLLWNGFQKNFSTPQSWQSHFAFNFSNIPSYRKNGSLILNLLEIFLYIFKILMHSLSCLGKKNSSSLQETELCRLLESFATCQRQGNRQTYSLPTASKNSWQRTLCRLPKCLELSATLSSRQRRPLPTAWQVAKKSWWQRWLGTNGAHRRPFCHLSGRQAVGKDEIFYF